MIGKAHFRLVISTHGHIVNQHRLIAILSHSFLDKIRRNNSQRDWLMGENLIDWLQGTDMHQQNLLAKIDDNTTKCQP